jgi:hypothetical protein
MSRRDLASLCAERGWRVFSRDTAAVLRERAREAHRSDAFLWRQEQTCRVRATVASNSPPTDTSFSAGRTLLWGVANLNFEGDGEHMASVAAALETLMLLVTEHLDGTGGVDADDLRDHVEGMRAVLERVRWAQRERLEALHRLGRDVAEAAGALLTPSIL